jgi:simple sugar transport system ATP-binding protein
VLRHIAQARDRGVGVVFITHDPDHAHPVGDRLLLGRGRTLGDVAKDEVSVGELTRMVAGRAELDGPTSELERPQSEKGRGQPSRSPVRVTRTDVTGVG